MAAAAAEGITEARSLQIISTIAAIRSKMGQPAQELSMVPLTIRRWVSLSPPAAAATEVTLLREQAILTVAEAGVVITAAAAVMGLHVEQAVWTVAEAGGGSRASSSSSSEPARASSVENSRGRGSTQDSNTSSSSSSSRGRSHSWSPGGKGSPSTGRSRPFGKEVSQN